MTIQYKTRTSIVHSIEHEGVDVPLAFMPYCEDDIHVKQVGNKLIVAYLVHDDDPSNPMEYCDGQGDIYTYGSAYACDRKITDDHYQMTWALGLDSNEEPDIDREFPCEPYISQYGLQVSLTSLRSLAAIALTEKIASTPDLMQEWLNRKDLELEEGETLESAAVTHRNDIWMSLEDIDGPFSEEVEKGAFDLYPKYWDQIAGPYVLPIHVSGWDGEHYRPTTWDGDHLDLPDGVWVANKDARDNLGDNPSKEQVTNYAASILEEYSSWAEGDVYGCVFEEFELVDGRCTRVDHDACWGYINHKYARESLKSETFDPAVKRMQEG